MITIKHEKYGDITFDNGTSREEITNYLVELEAKSGEQFGTLETIGHQAGRSMGSSVRGVKSWLGVDGELAKYEDEQAELKSRIMMEQNPVASVTGMLGGGFLDPVTLPALALKPLTFASKAGTYASRGAAQGAFGGVLEPVYEQYGDSSMLNILTGATLGGALGGAVGKFLTKSTTGKTAKEVSDKLEETSQSTITDLAKSIDAPARTPEQAINKIREEMELQAKGAPSDVELKSLKTAADAERSNVNKLGSIINKMGNRLGTRKASKVMQARKVEAQRKVQELDVKHAEGTTLRKAAINLEKLNAGKFSKIEGWDAKVEAKTRLPQTKMTQAVQGNAPKPSPLSSKMSRILGVENETDSLGVGVPFPSMHRSVGSAAVSKEHIVGGDLLPRTVDKPEVTAGVVSGKYKGKNPETRINIKESKAVKEAREELERKANRGEELSPEDVAKFDEVTAADKAINKYKEFVQKIAGSRSLDTAALRGYMKGRHTFANIEARAKALLKKNGIEDFEDMIDYILRDKDRLFSAEEMEMLTPLFAETERKLFNAMQLTEFTDELSSTEIALLHSDINLFYGIQAWNKGQGSKVSAALNHRNKMLKDVAEGRMIDSLFLGVKCK